MPAELSAAPRLDDWPVDSSVAPLAWDVRGLADALAVSVATVWRLHSAGRLPRPVRIGRSVRWPVADVRAWLAAGAPDRGVWEAMRPRK
jgi:predicted DNA-binding transcriptional regulator AlpA